MKCYWIDPSCTDFMNVKSWGVHISTGVSTRVSTRNFMDFNVLYLFYICILMYILHPLHQIPLVPRFVVELLRLSLAIEFEMQLSGSKGFLAHLSRFRSAFFEWWSRFVVLYMRVFLLCYLTLFMRVFLLLCPQSLIEESEGALMIDLFVPLICWHKNFVFWGFLGFRHPTCDI